MSGYGPRGFEQRNTFRLRNPDDLQQGFSYPLRRDEPGVAREDHRPTADRWPTTEDRWSGDNDRWAAPEDPRFAAAPWSTENRWPENHWPPAAEQWAEDWPTATDEQPGDPTPTDQWTWSNDRWQSPNEPWAIPAAPVPDDRSRASRRDRPRQDRSNTSYAPRTAADRRADKRNGAPTRENANQREYTDFASGARAETDRAAHADTVPASDPQSGRRSRGTTHRAERTVVAQGLGFDCDSAAYIGRGQSDVGGNGLTRDAEIVLGAQRRDQTVTPGAAEPRKRRGGRHRMPPPPTALKGRAAIVAVAAGAIVAAGQNLETGSAKEPAQSVAPMAQGQPQAVEVAAAGAAPNSTDPGLLAEGPATLGQFADMLQNGSKVADEIAADVQAKLRPLFVKFTSGTFTSGYGMRWGTLHPGVDVAAPIGTPIVAVEDGTVISAGPASGFGMWVRVLGDDGTVTVYGHINTALVSVGQHVTAGDEIATVGNRGETTGPHCHFEVWLNGTDRIDPLPWLATRGIGLGPERD
ncbi:peptidoglycan DD-metalloendopeptidase family protein [Nocardia brasiliensis]|uniref:peptidoglycan DD-metalloendopeptidase family protein n=1 Tax=Nocardia brasiliensis TaxID=37326 RepID=UPI00313C92F8